MAFLRYAAPALAVAAQVLAQDSDGCSATTTTLQSQGDAAALASCTTFTGSIAIATGTTDNIALDGIQEIQGSLIGNNATQVPAMSAGDLQTITGAFDLDSMLALTSLSFPQLGTVGSINWNALPKLQGLAFSNGITSASSVMIANTQLHDLNGIDLQNVDTITVTNNPFLNLISMQLETITQSLILNANGPSLEADFENLVWAYNMTMRNCSSVMVPSLASVNGSLGFIGNSFQNFSAPNLTTVGGSLSFVAGAVNNISMPELTIIGGAFVIGLNPQLQTIDGFDALKTVGGAVVLVGSLDNVTLPSLQSVQGAFNLTSTLNDTASCNTFQKLKSSGGIHGQIACPTPKSSSSGGSNPSVTGSGSSPSSTQSGAGALLIPGTTVILGAVAALFMLL